LIIIGIYSIFIILIRGANKNNTIKSAVSKKAPFSEGGGSDIVADGGCRSPDSI